MDQSHGFLWADIAGFSLTPEDKDLLAHPFISGVILFSRNYESPQQLRELTQQIAAVSKQLIITVDQEGGRVQRFREGFTELPSMNHWGSQYQCDKEQTKKAFQAAIDTMMRELQNAGIYSSLVPVLDINYQRNAVIGHRSFGSDASMVTELGALAVKTFHDLKTPVTGKHFPGHGWVTVDSHLDLPHDERPFETIKSQDLQPFATLSNQLDAIMLAHVVYTQIDPVLVCFSHFWIQDVLRDQLKFDGLVITDDLSMQAVAKMGSYSDRADRALDAGCDILLVCNSRDGVIDILDHVQPNKNDQLARRLAHYHRF